MIVVSVVDPIDVWGQSLRARLPGADPGAWALELESTVEEFCKRSLCLIQELEIPYVAEQGVYALNPVTTTVEPIDSPWGGVHALYVHFLHFPDDPRRHIPHDRYPSPVRDSIGVPVAFWVPSPAEIEVIPAPSSELAGRTMRVTTSLIPKRPMKWMPEMISDYYFEVILDGALGRMLSHPKRPYSDPQLAAYHMKRYRNGMREAKDESLRRWGNAEIPPIYNSEWSWKPALRHTR
jgi:hypothetical protein